MTLISFLTSKLVVQRYTFHAVEFWELLSTFESFVNSLAMVEMDLGASCAYIYTQAHSDKTPFCTFKKNEPIIKIFWEFIFNNKFIHLKWASLAKNDPQILNIEVEHSSQCTLMQFVMSQQISHSFCYALFLVWLQTWIHDIRDRLPLSIPELPHSSIYEYATRNELIKARDRLISIQTANWILDMDIIHAKILGKVHIMG